MWTDVYDWEKSRQGKVRVGRASSQKDGKALMCAYQYQLIYDISPHIAARFRWVEEFLTSPSLHRHTKQNIIIAILVIITSLQISINLNKENFFCLVEEQYTLTPPINPMYKRKCGADQIMATQVLFRLTHIPSTHQSVLKVSHSLLSMIASTTTSKLFIPSLSRLIIRGFALVDRFTAAVAYPAGSLAGG